MKLKKEPKPNKVGVTLATFSKAEQRAFSQFIISPFFNQREDVIRLYQWIQKGEALAPKEQAFEYVYSGAPFDEQKLRLVQSYLQRLAEQFLAYQHWRNTPGAYESDLVQVFRHRGLEIHFQEALKTAKVVLDRQPLRNGDYRNRLEKILWEEARFESLRHPTEVKYLEQLSDNADLIWVTQKLRYLCLNRTQQIMYKADHPLRLRQEVERVVKQAGMLQNPVVATWFYCLKMLEQAESVGFFSQFKKVFLEQGQLFNGDEIRDLYLFAINYCIRQVNEGHKQFFHDIMDFYKDGLQKEYLFDKGILSRFTYHNIVAAALQTREFEWVEDFIGRYKNTLERSYRDSSYSFSLARLEFTRKRYDAALHLLQHSNYYDPLLSLAAKTMALKIYYELGEFDLLHAHLEALKNYIRRKANLGYHRDNYLNLVRYTQKLIMVNRFDKREVRQLQQKISNEPVLTEREWLLEQLSIQHTGNF